MRAVRKGQWWNRLGDESEKGSCLQHLKKDVAFGSAKSLEPRCGSWNA